MALIKEIATPYGPSIKANYHHICEVGWTKDERLVVQLAGHASKGDREVSGTVALGRINIELEKTSDLPRLAEIYALIKATSEWTDAQDA